MMKDKCNYLRKDLTIMQKKDGKKIKAQYSHAQNG